VHQFFEFGPFKSFICSTQIYLLKVFGSSEEFTFFIASKRRMKYLLRLSLHLTTRICGTYSAERSGSIPKQKALFTNRNHDPFLRIEVVGSMVSKTSSNSPALRSDSRSNPDHWNHLRSSCRSGLRVQRFLNFYDKKPKR
jgi:hypothetical protein